MMRGIYSQIGSLVPELPNFITLLYHRYPDAPWAQFLHHWQNLVFSILIALLVCGITYLGMRARKMIPSGLQNFLELALEEVSKIILEVLGPRGKVFIPFLITLFIYILSMNLAGLVPFMKAPSSNLNITASLAICVFCLVQYLNIKNMGFFGFLFHLAGSPKTALEWALAPLMFFLELIAQLARPITLALRLFGNVLGEDILIGFFAVTGVALVSVFQSPVGIPLQIPAMFLALLTGLMQASVFTLLSAVYILLSMPHEEHPPSGNK